MDILSTVGIIITIIAGSLAVTEKIWGIFPGRRKSKRLFKSYFKEWKDSGHDYLPTHDEFRRTKSYAISNKLSKEEQAFSLLCALQHGDRSLNALIKKNRYNEVAVKHTIRFVKGRGSRVGWRAEYALTHFPDHLVEEHLKKNGRNIPQEAISRISQKKVKDYLEMESNSGEGKEKDYAREVLRQISL